MEDYIYVFGKEIEEAAEEYAKKRNQDNLYKLYDVLFLGMYDGLEVRMPMIDVNNVMDSFNITNLSVGDTFTLGKEVRLRIDKYTDGNGNEWIPIYTDDDEMNPESTTNINIIMPIYNVLKSGLEEDVAGIVINPFGLDLKMPKDVLFDVVDAFEELRNS